MFKPEGDTTVVMPVELRLATLTMASPSTTDDTVGELPVILNWLISYLILR